VGGAFLDRKEYDTTDVDKKEQIAALSFIIFWSLGILSFVVGFGCVIAFALMKLIIDPSFQIPFF
jgi:hypothetical protein